MAIVNGNIKNSSGVSAKKGGTQSSVPASKGTVKDLGLAPGFKKAPMSESCSKSMKTDGLKSSKISHPVLGGQIKTGDISTKRI